MQYDVLFQLNEAYRHEVYAEETLSEAELADINGWVSQLISEGYDLDDYSDEELYAAYLEEMNQPIVRSGTSVNAAGQKINWTHKHNPNTGRSTVTDKFSTRDATVRSNKDSDMRNKSRMREQADLYDIVSEYLVSEGFCDSYEDADVIMANMSEEWRESIVNTLIEEGFVSPYKAPHAHGRSMDNPGRLSPAMKAMDKSYKLQRTEPGSERQKKQTRRSNQLNRMFSAARRA